MNTLQMEIPFILNHSRLEASIPWIIRLTPCVYNFWYRRLYLRSLTIRQGEAVRQAWLAVGVPLELVEIVSAVIAHEYSWPRATLFHPEDECYVLFCFWRRTWVDSLELPCCVMQIEEKLGVELSESILPQLRRMLFGNLCKELVLLAKSSSSSEFRRQ